MNNLRIRVNTRSVKPSLKSEGLKRTKRAVKEGLPPYPWEVLSDLVRCIVTELIWKGNGRSYTVTRVSLQRTNVGWRLRLQCVTTKRKHFVSWATGSDCRSVCWNMYRKIKTGRMDWKPDKYPVILDDSGKT